MNTTPTLIDRLIGYIAPRAALGRHVARANLARAYEGASPRDGWRPKRAGASANSDHRADAPALRARSRSLTQNTPYVAAAIRALVANTIGTGIVPDFTGPSGAVLQKEWAVFAKECDADGRLDIYGMQAAADRAMEVDGEVLIRKRWRRKQDGYRVPLQLQLLEIDWLDTARCGTVNGDTIINGIQYDILGRKVGYWLFEEHPGESGAYNLRASIGQSRFVPADLIIHLYNPERPGQGRGFPRVSPVIARVRDLQLYEDAELARKNLESRLTVLASGDVSQMAVGGPGQLADPAAAKITGDLGSLESGSVFGLPAGMSMQVVEPKAPPGYVDYLKINLHLVAAGMGVLYEMLSSDGSDGSFSSNRALVIQFRRETEQLQWLTLVPRLCGPINTAFVDAVVLAGTLSRPDYEVEFSTPKWDYVNPIQDVKAEAAEVASGLCTLSEKLRKRGYKPDAVFKEHKSDYDRLNKDGTLDYLLLLQRGKITAAGPGDVKPVTKTGA